MNIEDLERLIDEAIEKEDYKRAAELYDERERLLKEMGDIPQDLARKLIERDKERERLIKERMRELFEVAKMSDAFQKSLQALQKFSGDSQKRSWGRG